MKKRIIFIVFSVAVIVLFTTVVFAGMPNPASDSLSPEQIAVLRAEYPLHSGVPAVPATASMIEQPIQLSLNQIVSLSDTLLYAKVLGEIKPYSVQVEGHQIIYFGYNLEIISDSAGMFKESAQVPVCVNIMLKEMYPDLAEGTEIVVPIARYPNEEEAYAFSAHGMFYITKDGYALSAYDMEEAVAKDGMRVDELLKELWRMRTDS